MKNYIGSAVLASAAFFSAIGNAWADDFASVVDVERSTQVVSGAVVQSAGDTAWTIGDYVNARRAETAQPIVISMASRARVINDAARSL